MVWMPVIPELRRQEKENWGPGHSCLKREREGGKEGGGKTAGRQAETGRESGRANCHLAGSSQISMTSVVTCQCLTYCH